MAALAMPPDQQAYYETVWEIVRQVPRGQVVTFGQIAAMIPPPAGVDPEFYQRVAPRWVGYAMNAVSFPDEPTVPWHRVINSKGGISLEAGSKPAVLQRTRLEAEGVQFDSKDTIDFDRFGWDGPDDTWLREHTLLKPHSMKSPPPAPDAPQQLSLF
jgi:methylated-DNA-protein-cysteine methyltransferase-like protein